MSVIVVRFGHCGPAVSCSVHALRTINRSAINFLSKKMPTLPEQQAVESNCTCSTCFPVLYLYDKWMQEVSYPGIKEEFTLFIAHACSRLHKNSHSVVFHHTI